MALKFIPDGYHTVTPYLTVVDADRQIEFLRNAFAGKLMVSTYDVQGGTRHAEVQVGDSIVIVTRLREQFHPRPMNFYLYVPDCDDFYRKAIAAGAKPIQEPSNQADGDRTSGVEDPEGNYWWIATHIEDVSDDEMLRRMKAGAQHRSAA